MAKLTIDNIEVEVPEGSTILDAANQAGIEIPTLCYMEGHPPNSTCMVCVVKITGGRGKLVPACAAPAQDGLVIESDTDEVLEARRTALELLLSNHLGDCEAPCHGICPAHMDIPRMIRSILSDKLDEGIRIVKADIALPAVLGRICPEICERGCRRKQGDSAVSICLLKRYVADKDLESPSPHKPECKADTGKRVAVVGGGPAGLAATYYLRQMGHGVTLFDEHDKLGGALRYGIEREKLPLDVLDREIATIEALGFEFEPGKKVGRDISLAELREQFDAVFLGVGKLDESEAGELGLKYLKKGLAADKNTMLTSQAGVYSGGDAVRPNQLTVMACGDGKSAAIAIDQQLRGREVVGEPKPFSVHVGRLQEGEFDEFQKESTPHERVELESKVGPGFTDEQAKIEAARCLHCDCRKPESCKLRRWSEALDASAKKFGSMRPQFVQMRKGKLVYEPGKCIKCGMCIRIATEEHEELGLAFVGRGFDVHVGGGFSRPVLEGIAKAGEQCVNACPTAALSFISGEDEHLLDEQVQTADSAE
jgi:NADPH-dependent glutamate synthase beta subunit-like oxidoreductase